MSKNIIPRIMHGITIEQRSVDGYLNATKLAKAYEAGTGVRKDVRDWLSTDRAKAYIQFISAKTGIPVLELVQVKKGGNTPGTWLHPKLATPFGTWLSVEFEFQVSEWMEEWITRGDKQNHSNPTEQYFLSLILDEPRTWKEHFKSEWIAEAERLTGWGWNWRCMSGFLNATVYSYFPEPMLSKLDEVNPLDESGRRPNKQHQHFREDADEKALKKHIDTVFTLMEVSASLDEFWRLMNAKFSGAIQLQIF